MIPGNFCDTPSSGTQNRNALAERSYARVERWLADAAPAAGARVEDVLYAAADTAAVEAPLQPLPLTFARNKSLSKASFGAPRPLAASAPWSPPPAVFEYRSRDPSLDVSGPLVFASHSDRDRIETAVRHGPPPLPRTALASAAASLTPSSSSSPASRQAHGHAASSVGMRLPHRSAGTASATDRARSLTGARLSASLAASEPYIDPLPRSADCPLPLRGDARPPLRAADAAAAAAHTRAARAAAVRAADAAAAAEASADGCVGCVALRVPHGKDYWASARTVAFAQLTQTGAGVPLARLPQIYGQPPAPAPPEQWRPTADGAGVGTGASAFPTALAKTEAGRLASAARDLGPFRGRRLDLSAAARSSAARPSASERALALTLAKYALPPDAFGPPPSQPLDQTAASARHTAGAGSGAGVALPHVGTAALRSAAEWEQTRAAARTARPAGELAATQRARAAAAQRTAADQASVMQLRM